MLSDWIQALTGHDMLLGGLSHGPSEDAVVCHGNASVGFQKETIWSLMMAFECLRMTLVKMPQTSYVVCDVDALESQSMH